MRFKFANSVFSMVLIASLLVFATGCGQRADDSGTNDGPTQASDASHEEHNDGGEEEGHDHSGWWCNEHGVPEKDCSLCSSRAAAKFKAKGDWCEEHHRADSQCFKCDPSRADKFARLYEAKFGKLPPEPACE